MAPGERVPHLYREPNFAEENGVVMDFYEDDEPVAEVVAAFEQAPKGLTGPADPAEPTDAG
jgi:hypothetical protein